MFGFTKEEQDISAVLKIFDGVFREMPGAEEDCTALFLEKFEERCKVQADNRTLHELAASKFDKIPMVAADILGTALGILFRLVRQFSSGEEICKAINKNLMLDVIRLFAGYIKKFKSVKTVYIKGRILSYSRKIGMPKDAKNILTQMASLF